MELNMDEEFVIIDNKYKLIRKLGSGGFGNVWLADDILIPNRQVAIKSLRRQHVIEESPLISEMQFLNSLDHPNIIKFYHHIRDEEILYLVMEYCKGGSLDKIRAYGPRAASEVFDWALTITDTMKVVHSNAIIHHDIKPENILLTERGQIKIADFGIANQDIGTIYYLAPEQLLTELEHTNDPRIDIYALGLTLLELLTGINPFSGLSRKEALRSKIQHDFVPRHLERWVQEILLRATHPTPEQRFQTMAEFQEAIVARSVPYHFDSDRIKAQLVAINAKSLLKKKKWKSAEKACETALRLSPNNVPVLITAGQVQLMLQETNRAENYFTRAVTINPRAGVQKELGWIALQNGHYTKAVSMLNDYLQRDATDYEAYNLLLECLYRNDRYHAGSDCCRQIIDLDKRFRCFENNNFLFNYLDGKISQTKLFELKNRKDTKDFLKFNLDILLEPTKSYDPTSEFLLKKKLLFQDFRFNEDKNSKNRILIRVDDGSALGNDDHIISIGRNLANEIHLSHSTVSRRHAVIVNYRNDVWIYDLGSTLGIYVDGERISEKRFLNGVHSIDIGQHNLMISTSEGLLV